MATIDDVKASYKAIIRVDLNDAAAAATAAAIDGGQLSLQQYQNSLIQQAAPTTSAALALSTLITGTVPTSAKLDELTAFAKTQNDYYTNVLKSGNAQLGAYEALGRAYAIDSTTSAAFAGRFGALSTADFVAAAYASAFSTAPTAGATANLIAQVNYFTNLYVAAGIPSAQASLQAKGAVFGQIVGYAVTTPNAATGPQSTLDDQINTTLDLIADQAVAKIDSTVYGKALAGVSGATIAILADGSVSLDVASNGAAPNNVKATGGNDTVTGTISNTVAGTTVTINTAAGDDLIGTAATPVTITEGAATALIKIDGSGGADTLYGTLTASLVNTTIANVEKVYLGTAAAGITVDTTKITGAQQLWSYKTGAGADITFDGIASGTVIGADSVAATSLSTFNFATGTASANLALKGSLSGSEVAINGAGTTLKTVNVDATANSITKLTLGASVETVVVTGAGEVGLTALSNTVKTFDASGATKSVSLGSTTAFDGAAATTIKLGSAADSLNVKFTNQFKDTITLGAGNDTVTVKADTATDFANVKLTAGAITSFADFTDFTKGDKITVDFAAGAGAAVTSLTGQATLETAIGALVTAEGAKAAAGIVFEYAGATYIYKDVGAAGLQDGDGLIKLAGTGYTVAATGDIVLV